MIFYYSFLSTTDTRLYKPVVDAILERRKVGSEARKEIKNVQDRLLQKKLTEDGKSRERKICEKLIFRGRETKLILYFYSFGLEYRYLKKYVCLFQSNQ